MANLTSNTYVFTKKAVVRSIHTLEQMPIHEHFAGYLAILRAQQSNAGLPIRMGDIAEFHDRYMRVIGAQDKAPYVRPFRSRGRGLQTFNANVSGSYAPSSLRSKGKLIDVIGVNGERVNASYRLKEGHAALARDRLLGGRTVPVGALVAFLYRDYGFRLEHRTVAAVVTLFRKEFGLSSLVFGQNEIFRTLFSDDLETFSADDLEAIES